MSVWEDSDEAACLLPMHPLYRGKAAIEKAWSQLLHPEMRVDVSVKHLQWIESSELAIHLVEETVTLPNGQKQPPIYATNVYRKGSDGWHMLVHLNAPTPPPPGLANQGMLGI